MVGRLSIRRARPANSSPLCGPGLPASLGHTYRTVQQLCKDQNIGSFVFHDLRHCAVTNLADAGVDIETIMKIVGHSSVEMFLRYRSVKGEKLDAAMKCLDVALNTVITPANSAAI